jgi:hypothetical protein
MDGMTPVVREEERIKMVMGLAAGTTQFQPGATSSRLSQNHYLAATAAAADYFESVWASASAGSMAEKQSCEGGGGGGGGGGGKLLELLRLLFYAFCRLRGGKNYMSSGSEKIKNGAQ